jgi:hypothetical protein
MRNRVPGTIRDVRFRNLTVSGKPGAYRVQIQGADARHDVRSVSLEKVEILGVPLTAGSDRVQAGPHVADLQFK